MSRRARVIVPGLPHHITQRGNRRSEVFKDDKDRRLYLQLLRQHATKNDVDVWTYCLMSNHTHLILVPDSESGLSATLRDTHGTYASAFNRKYGLTGHLWQARFYSCVLGDRHLWAAVRYVERNPVRAGMVARAEEYLWSSAAAHVAGRADPYLDDGCPVLRCIDNWSAWLADDDDATDVAAIRRATSVGRVCGSDLLVRQLEAILGRRLHYENKGPEPKPIGLNLDVDL